MVGKSSELKRVVVIGAGIGGLTTAAVLARAGLDVTVLEAHIYPGGCAGTFYHQGYRFDAGATLAAGFYSGGPMDIIANTVGIDDWSLHSEEPAMVVHLPNGAQVPRFGDERRHEAHRQAFGQQAECFWQWQEATADALWALALRSPPWPPSDAREALRLAGTGLRWLGSDFPVHLRPSLVADAFRPLGVHLRNLPDTLRLFVDGQLLIAAQTTSARANALYGAAALDLPRRGVVQLAGGMGAIAEALAAAVSNQGGRVLYRQRAERIVTEQGQPVAVTTARGGSFPADLVVVNLPPWNIAPLFGDDVPARLRNLPGQPVDGWGAFMIYAGMDGGVIDATAALHQQVIVREPMGGGNTIFISISPAWDASRAPADRRAVTISTHTDLRPWWRLFEQDHDHYTRRKQVYAERLLAAAEQAIPDFRAATDLILPGTPVTFQRFTRRARGWVGGFPQTDLFRTWRPMLADKLWMVGDSIFPGQSTAAVALGGLRVAGSILAQLGIAQHPKPATSSRLRPLPEH